MRYALSDRLILRSYTWWQRFRRPRSIGFTAAFHKTARLLICLPSDPDEAQAAVSVVSGLVSCLHAREVTIIAPEAVKDTCDALSFPARIITIGPKDRKWLGLPSTAFVTRVVGDGLDAAIDLNPQLDVSVASLCSQTGAQLRICFRAPYRDLFFNVQIAVSSYPPPSGTTGATSEETGTDHPVKSSRRKSKNRPQRHTDDLKPDSPYTRFLHTIEGLMGQPS